VIHSVIAMKRKKKPIAIALGSPMPVVTPGKRYSRSARRAGS
jgi:hypothetical protein